MKPTEPSRTALIPARQRAAHAEDALSGAVERGTRQIVIFGAGLDTFALRNPHGARQIRIYEIKSRFGSAVQGLAPGHAGLHVVHAQH